jgi:hypothetical protein
MASAFDFTTKMAMNFCHIVRVTGDETWVSFVNVETKEQPKQWLHTHSPDKPKKFKETFSACQKAYGNKSARETGNVNFPSKRECFLIPDSL